MTLISSFNILNSLFNNIPNDSVKRLQEHYNFKSKESLIAALIVIREQNLNSFTAIKNLIVNGSTFVEEELIVNDFLSIFEDAPVNATGAMVSTDQPVIKKRYTAFEVPEDTFNNVNGKSPFRNVISKLNLENYDEKMLYNFHKNNPNTHFVLKHKNSVKLLAP